ncbi:exodeoxyribonuclease VII large subunit [Conexibacter sp. JD483]|uniref:exodeoxyribonuclease VII large subunit n=1 Tax=unclassified Conexibacter TaxID=2627773 RepID=UPI00271E483C|nr:MULTISPECIES: exodeoxyribonuclease VII large subunit [unclassified Conexibacter]MDO8187188.1 exodeoxyribonuclease VII large subunit [Conexibacter sp. CPCC 205706]MDO8199285.1 exodeoxyribonuclease VII large subunit [Conexibacter sp. CPCC 205762]MDR9369314.1 exodeoxyribonuclease VII large subunit [Conexibacter sp. JD483]
MNADGDVRGAASGPPAGIPGSSLPGPFAVGVYADKLRQQLRGFARVQVFGELWNFRTSRTTVYFELRDPRGALPCAMWRSDFDELGVEPSDGAQVVLAGGCDYYPGSATSSPSFSFRATDLRIAGEGDLLAQVERLRRMLAAEGLLEPQKHLPRPLLPRTIGVVTGETGKARDDVVAALKRRGWAGRLVWAFAPVQDRHAAPRIAQALRDLAAIEQVEVVIVARGGGSLADLFAFCDETLCRTVALLRVPVIASVGHHTDRTLIDDVAAVCCSTPTHAAEAAVQLDVAQARAALLRETRRLDAHGRRAVLERARTLAGLARAPAEHIARHRRRLHQQLRELRAAARRRNAREADLTATRLLVLRRKRDVTAAERTRAETLLRSDGERLRHSSDAAISRRARDLERLRLALAAHDPARALERGYALVEDRDGALVTSAEQARASGALELRFHDGRVRADVEDAAR